jgi:hypothetical protein
VNHVDAGEVAGEDAVGGVSADLVAGERNTVAVNYWYDMRFDARYAYYKFAEGLARDVLPP